MAVLIDNYLLFCPLCGLWKTTAEPFTVHDCKLCGLKYLPNKKPSKPDKDAILVTRPAPYQRAEVLFQLNAAGLI